MAIKTSAEIIDLVRRAHETANVPNDDVTNDVMSADEIVDLVNNHVTYKPGWFISAAVRWGWSNAPDGVTVRTEREVVNSSPRAVDPRSHVVAGSHFTVNVGTRDAVLAQVLEGLLDAELHEAREFMRVDGEAPFHPHRDDGNARFTSVRRHGLRVIGY